MKKNIEENYYFEQPKKIIEKSYLLEEAKEIAFKLLRIGRRVELIDLVEGFCNENGSVLLCKIKTNATSEELENL